MRGNCRYGDKCHYEHPRDPGNQLIAHPYVTQYELSFNLKLYYSHLVKVDFDVRAPILFTVMKGRQVFPVEVFDRATGPVYSGEILLPTARCYQVLKINYL